MCVATSTKTDANINTAEGATLRQLCCASFAVNAAAGIERKTRTVSLDDAAGTDTQVGSFHLPPVDAPVTGASASTIW